ELRDGYGSAHDGHLAPQSASRPGLHPGQAFLGCGPVLDSPPMPEMRRRRTVTVDVGGVKVGSAHPIVVQSMTNTDTADADATAAQVRALHQAGSELVRVTVNNEAAAEAVPHLGAQVGVAVIGDCHANGSLL